MKVKAKDVAQTLGISTAAVSLAMNDKPGVSDETRRKVRQKLAELGYDNSPVIRLGKTIDFIVYKRHGEIIMESPFFSLLIENIDLTVRSHGYQLSIQHIDRTIMEPEQIRALLRASKSDGMIIFATEMIEEDLLPFQDACKPFVLVDNRFHDQKVNSVSIDNEYGTYLAVRHLVAMGHKTIGYLKSKVQINSFDQRFSGFRKAMETLGVGPMEDRYVYSVGYPETGAYRDFRAILSSGAEMPTALFADNDLIAFGACKALKECGFSVPGDVSMIGFDDRPVCKLMEPPLTTVDVPKDLFGAMAVYILFNRMERENAAGTADYSLKLEVGTILVERESVRHIANGVN